MFIFDLLLFSSPIHPSSFLFHSHANESTLTLSHQDHAPLIPSYSLSLDNLFYPRIFSSTYKCRFKKIYPKCFLIPCLLPFLLQTSQSSGLLPLVHSCHCNLAFALTMFLRFYLTRSKYKGQSLYFN